MITEAEQEFGWYYIHPNMDGTIQVNQSGNPTDVLRLRGTGCRWRRPITGSTRPAWTSHGWSRRAHADRGAAAGTSYADLYNLGTTDPAESRGEEDIVAVGARSFAGSTIDGDAEGTPPGDDAFAGIDWLSFLSDDTAMVEPVEVGVQTWNIHNVTETLEVDVLIDVGADGVFADEDLQADYLAVKQAAPLGEVCLFDLSLPTRSTTARRCTSPTTATTTATWSGSP